MPILVTCSDCGKETRFIWRQEDRPLCSDCEHEDRQREKALARVYVVQEEP
jgi:endogenous inhibitor of DNA gyrase (YacG/DUF329 family)